MTANNDLSSLYVNFAGDRLMRKLRGWLRPELALEQLHESFLAGPEAPATLVCAAYPRGQAAEGHEDLRALVERHNGVADRISPCALLACFASPISALQVALHLQSLPTRFGVALVNGVCAQAAFTVHGRDWHILVGGDVTRAEAIASQVAPGTIHVSPEAFATLEQHLTGGIGNALLMAEYVDEVVTEATITLAPQPSAESSTFAGLGLTST